MLQVASISHSVGALIFALTTIVLMFHQSTRKQFPLLIISTAVTCTWCVLAALYNDNIISHYGMVAIAEVLQDATWCLCIMKLIQLTHQSKQSRWFDHWYFKIFLFFLTGSLILNTAFMSSNYHTNLNEFFTKYSFVGHIALSVVALSLIEHLYLGTVPERRWGIKFICIGLGILFCYDFYLFANALLLNGVNHVMWEVRGAVSAIIAPLIAWGALRNRKWQSTLMPSRRLIFSSTAFISCGVYLILMASVGYGIRQFGGNWGQALQIVFLTGSLVLLILLLASGSARAFLQEFLVKNFFKLRYDYRNEWLKLSEVFYETDSQHIHQRTIQTIANLVESPRGWLFEKNEADHFSLIETWNARFPDTEIQITKSGFARELSNTLQPIHCSDAFKGLFQHLTDQDSLWLLVPLKLQAESPYFILLSKPRTQIKVNWEVQDILMMAGRHLAAHLIQNKNAKALTIAKQFEAYNQFAAFIVHDLKNIDTQLKLMSSNKVKHGDNPKFVKSVYETIDNLSEKLSKLMNQIKTPGISQQQIFPLRQSIEQAVEMRSHQMPKPIFKWSSQFDEVELEGDPSQFINILGHLIENAQQATPKDGTIIVQVEEQNKIAHIRIQDTGQGMTQDFIKQKLFKPFSSTKGKKGMGIGVYQAKTYIESQQGKIQVQSKLGKGTIFLLKLPIKHVVTHNNIHYCEESLSMKDNKVRETT